MIVEDSVKGLSGHKLLPLLPDPAAQRKRHQYSFPNIVILYIDMTGLSLIVILSITALGYATHHQS